EVPFTSRGQKASTDHSRTVSRQGRSTDGGEDEDRVQTVDAAEELGNVAEAYEVRPEGVEGVARRFSFREVLIVRWKNSAQSVAIFQSSSDGNFFFEASEDLTLSFPSVLSELISFDLD